MGKTQTRLFILAACLAIPLGLAGVALCAAGGAFDLSRFSVTPGGIVESGGFAARGTAGQAESGVVSAGGDFGMRSGFFVPLTDFENAAGPEWRRYR